MNLPGVTGKERFSPPKPLFFMRTPLTKFVTENPRRAEDLLPRHPQTLISPIYQRADYFVILPPGKPS